MLCWLEKVRFEFQAAAQSGLLSVWDKRGAVWWVGRVWDVGMGCGFLALQPLSPSQLEPEEGIAAGSAC